LKVATLSAGNAFGEMSLLDDAPRMATCAAVGHVRCVALCKADFELTVPKGFLDELADQRKAEAEAKAAAAAAAASASASASANAGEVVSPPPPPLDNGSNSGGSSGSSGEPLPWVAYETIRTMAGAKSFGAYDPTKLESYLSAQDFAFRFAMEKEQFASLPKWKRDNMKRLLSLY
jgi:hypothetical protein